MKISIRKFLPFILAALWFLPLLSYDKVVIWGHKLHTHTHSYIHEGFYKAFDSLGYKTYWFDQNDDVSNFDFSDTLFLTEGQADGNIPLRSDCTYILHNITDRKYEGLNKICLQVYNDTLFDVPSVIKIDHCIYYDFPGNCVYMPWATDLLPKEIDAVKQKMTLNAHEPYVYWIGTIGTGPFGNQTEINPFIKACEDNDVKFVAVNPWGTGISQEEHIRLISGAYMAPAIVGSWQLNAGYIPCRIFKNISYGQIGITNSKRVHELFEGKIVYNPDTYQLFYDAQKKLSTTTLEDQGKLMDFVKNKHTYLNRVETLLRFIRIRNLYLHSIP